MQVNANTRVDDVVGRIAELLGLDLVDPSGSILLSCLVAPCIFTSETARRLHGIIGLPSRLVGALEDPHQSVDAPLPVELGAMLVRAATLFALAEGLFESASQTRAWWHRPLPLKSGGRELSPAEWIADVGASAELARRIRITESGTF